MVEPVGSRQEQSAGGEGRRQKAIGKLDGHLGEQSSMLFFVFCLLPFAWWLPLPADCSYFFLVIISKKTFIGVIYAYRIP